MALAETQHSPAFELSGLQVISDSFSRAAKLVAEDDLTAHAPAKFKERGRVSLRMSRHAGFG